MDLQPGHLYHIYNRGNNREPIFFRQANYLLFVRKLRAATEGNVAVLAWCLMPNHFHLLVQALPEVPPARAFNRRLAPALSSYTNLINKQEGRTGSLFQVRTKAKPVTDLAADPLPVALTCFHYIHQNPLRAGLVTHLERWPWSSYLDYAGLRAGTWCPQALTRELLDLPADSAAFRAASMQAIDVGRLRAYLHTERPAV